MSVKDKMARKRSQDARHNLEARAGEARLRQGSPLAPHLDYDQRILHI